MVAKVKRTDFSTLFSGGGDGGSGSGYSDSAGLVFVCFFVVSFRLVNNHPR